MTNDKEQSVRGEYEAHGVARYYEAVRAGGRSYRNPHEAHVHRALETAIDRWQLDLTRVLDLAAGSGEITLGLMRLRNRGHAVGQIDAADPYTFDLYRRRTGLLAEQTSFEDVAQEALAGREYSLIVCSYALHLVEPSRLPLLALQLSRVSRMLLVLTPNRRPEISATWGWEERGRFALEGVKARCYESVNPIPSSAS